MNLSKDGESWGELIRVLEDLQVHHGVDRYTGYLSKEQMFSILEALYAIATDELPPTGT